MSSQVQSVSKSLNKGNVNVNFNVNVTKKASAATVQVIFTGQDSVLLSKILWQFRVEKVLSCLENPNTHIFNAASGLNNIVFSCPDSKVLSSILLLYQFVLKHKLNPSLLKGINTKSDNYERLYNVVKSFKVIVTGKCKSTFNAVSNETPKFKALGDLLDGLYKKLSGKQSVKGVDGSGPVKCELNLPKAPGNKDLFGLYLAIVLGDTTCKASVNGQTVTLEFYDDTQCWIPLAKSSFKGRIKGFLTQYGAIGSDPDPKDSEKVAKYKVKSKTILESLSIASEITCQLHGLKPFKFESPNDARQVNAELLGLVKVLKH